MNGISVAVFPLFKCNCRLGGGAKKKMLYINTHTKRNAAAFKSLVTHSNKDVTIGPLLHSSQNASKKSYNIIAVVVVHIGQYNNKSQFICQ